MQHDTLVHSITQQNKKYSTQSEKERNEKTLRQQVEELKKKRDYKEQLLEQLKRETWKLRTKIQLKSEIRSAEQAEDCTCSLVEEEEE